MQQTWKNTDLAYFAGILDGEGSFCIFHVTSRYFGSRFQFSSTDPRLLQWAKAHFGGSIYDDPKEPNHKPCWRWIAEPRTMSEVLAAVLPFLIIKREQAELLLAFRETVRNRKSYRTPDVVKHARIDLHAQLAVLNKRGAAS